MKPGAEQRIVRIPCNTTHHWIGNIVHDVRKALMCEDNLGQFGLSLSTLRLSDSRCVSQAYTVTAWGDMALTKALPCFSLRGGRENVILGLTLVFKEIYTHRPCGRPWLNRDVGKDFGFGSQSLTWSKIFENKNAYCSGKQTKGFSVLRTRHASSECQSNVTLSMGQYILNVYYHVMGHIHIYTTLKGMKRLHLA